MADATTIPLHDLLSNSLVLRQLAPYVPVRSLLDLTGTSKTVRHVLLREPEAFRYLNLSAVKKAALKYNRPLDHGGVQWRSERMDEALTEDEFVSGPLRGMFSSLARVNILGNVQTLILDGLGVTAELVDEIISQDRFNVKTLSIRGCSLNEGRLIQVLKYAARPSRAEGMPRLKALYFFGQKDAPEPNRKADFDRELFTGQDSLYQAQDAGMMASEGAQLGSTWNEKSRDALNVAILRRVDTWYLPQGRVAKVKSNLAREWAEAIKACEGIIAFDAVLCRGPRHDSTRLRRGDTQAPLDEWLGLSVANVALGGGCNNCGSMPEAPAAFGTSPESHLPLLQPPPLHTSSVREAQKPHLTDPRVESYPSLYVRCEDCLKGRYCERCLKWWCESCYSPETAGKRLEEVSLSTPNDAVPITRCLAQKPESMKVHMGLCVETCLVGEMMSGAGSFGMWG